MYAKLLHKDTTKQKYIVLKYVFFTHRIKNDAAIASYQSKNITADKWLGSARHELMTQMSGVKVYCANPTNFLGKEMCGDIQETCKTIQILKGVKINYFNDKKIQKQEK